MNTYTFSKKNLKTQLVIYDLLSTEFHFERKPIILAKDNNEVFLRCLVNCLEAWNIHVISTRIDVACEKMSFLVLVQGKYRKVWVTFHLKE
jgi:hypothetical protein